MEKITSKDFRQTKEIKLPSSGLTLVCYSSLLVGEIVGMGSSKIDENDMDSSLNIIIKVIKEWNFYGSESDEKPLDITIENFKLIPASDFEYLVGEIKVFSTDQKKS